MIICYLQAKDKLDLAPFTLRTPAHIKLADQKDVISPSSLSAFFSIVKADEKLCALVEFIRNVPDKKVSHNNGYQFFVTLLNLIM